MKTYNINDDKVKICLTDDEVKSLFGSFDMIDYDSPRSRAILDSLICSALPEKVSQRVCEKVLIEVLPERGGCSIQVTRIYAGKNQRKQRRRSEYILLFECSEDMIKYIRSMTASAAIEAEKSRLYRAGGRYALFIAAEGPAGADPAAREFARIISEKDPLAAMITERGEYLYSGAVEKLYKAFVK